MAAGLDGAPQECVRYLLLHAFVVAFLFMGVTPDPRSRTPRGWHCTASAPAVAVVGQGHPLGKGGGEVLANRGRSTQWRRSKQ